MAEERYLDIDLLRTIEPPRRRRGKPGPASFLFILGLLFLIIEVTCSREAAIERGKRLTEVETRMQEIRAARSALEPGRQEGRVRDLADRILWRHVLVSLGGALPAEHRIERLYYEKGTLYLEIRGADEEKRNRFTSSLAADTLFVRFFPDVGPPVPITDMSYSVSCERRGEG